MIAIIDPYKLGYSSLPLPAAEPSQPAPCGHCAAYHPAPNVDGNLVVDPEIHLPSPGMDVDIAYYYNANSSYNGPFGYGRTLSPNLTLQASGNPLVVTMMRGNGALVNYRDDGTGVYWPSTPGVMNALAQDTTNSYWKETVPDGRVIAYPLDTTGKINSVTYAQDAVGNTHTFTYASGLLQSLQDTLGRRVTFGYTGANLLQSIQDWANRLTTFAYDTTSVMGKPLLTTVTGPSGCQTGYQYNSTPLLTGITDPNAQTTTYAYDGSGRVISRTITGVGTTNYAYGSGYMQTTDPLGGVVTQLLSTDNNLVGTIDAVGVQVSFTRNQFQQETSRQDPLGNVTTTVYDTNGNVTARIDAMSLYTSLVYDAYNNPTSLTYADGTIVTQVWGYSSSSFDTTGAKRRLQAYMDQLGNLTSYSYNSRGQLTAVQNALGNRTTYGYDGFGNRTSITDALGNVSTLVYDQAGNVLASVDPLGNRASATYDAQNRPLTTTDPLGNTTTRAYDGIGNLIVEINPLGYRTSWQYNAFDLPIKQTDALGNVWTSIYDAVGRLTASVDPLGNTNTTVYDLAGRNIASVDALGNLSTNVYDIAGRLVAVVNALGFASTTVYDSLDRVIAVEDALGNFTSYSYDLLSRLVSVQNARGYVSSGIYDKAGRPIATVDALGYRNSSTYDAMGHPVAVTDAVGYVTTANYDADGRLLAILNAVQAFTTLSYDAASRNIAVVNPLGNRFTTVYDAASRTIAAIDALNRRISFSYDAASRQVAVQNGLGTVTTNIYDGLDRLIAVTDPLGNRNSRTYDTVGNLKTTIDAKNQTITYSYDARYERTLRQFADGTQSVFSYDPVGNLLTVQDPTNPQDLSGRYTFSYDALNRLAVQQAPRQGGNASQPLTYTYDPNGNRQYLDCWWGRFTYAYDANDQMTSVVDPGDPLVAGIPGGLTSFSYDARGQITSQVNVIGTKTTTSYDALQRPSQILHTTSTQLYLEEAFTTYDIAGRPTTKTTLSGVFTYSYDAADQLIAENNPLSGLNTYTYDAAYRRTLLSAPTGRTTYSYDAADQMLTSTTGAAVTTYSYDQNGSTNLVNASGVLTSYSWDTANRLSKIVLPSNQVYTQNYRFDDLRFIEQGPEIGVFTRDGQDVLGWQEFPSGHTQLLVQGPETLVRAVGTRAGGIAVLRHYAEDAQGSVQTMTGTGGHGSQATETVYVNDAYGNILSPANPDSAAPYQPATYVGGLGYWFEPSVGLYYVRARWYNPQTGRWLSRDPIGFAGGDFNLYRYAGNRPSIVIDPTGTQIPGFGFGDLASLFRRQAQKVGTICPPMKGAHGTPQPWKIIPDPHQPDTPDPRLRNVRDFHRIVVDQYGNPYKYCGQPLKPNCVISIAELIVYGPEMKEVNIKAPPKAGTEWDKGRFFWNPSLNVEVSPQVPNWKLPDFTDHLGTLTTRIQYYTVVVLCESAKGKGDWKINKFIKLLDPSGHTIIGQDDTIQEVYPPGYAP